MEKEVLGFFMVIYEKSHTGEMTLGALGSSTCTPDTNPHLLFSPMWPQIPDLEHQSLTGVSADNQQDAFGKTRERNLW